MLPLLREHVTEILLASEESLERAVSLLLNVEKTLVEGAGAAGLAALLQYPERFRGRTVGTVLTGGNLDPRLLAAILTREQVREGRITRLRITVSDVPGQIARIATVVGRLEANFIDLQHQRIFTAAAGPRHLHRHHARDARPPAPRDDPSRAAGRGLRRPHSRRLRLCCGTA